MYSYEKIDLGNYRDNAYFLAGFVVPDPRRHAEYDPDEDADEYGVTLVRNAEILAKDNTEIVRLDNAHGQIPHVDKLYLPDDSVESEKTKLGDDWTYSRMRQFLLSEWRKYVNLYHHYQE